MSSFEELIFSDVGTVIRFREIGKKDWLRGRLNSIEVKVVNVSRNLLGEVLRVIVNREVAVEEVVAENFDGPVESSMFTSHPERWEFERIE